MIRQILLPRNRRLFFQVHVWAGISRRGATAIAIFTGILDSDGYQSLLEGYLKPFIEQHYPDSHRLWQDNDPKHTSKRTQQWMKDSGINWWPTPPESPDLNPIENIWAALKHHLRKNVKPSTKDELIQGIKDFWKNLTPSVCNRYIDHIYKVVPVIVARRGAASGY